MPKSHAPYAPEFRRQMVDLAGRPGNCRASSNQRLRRSRIGCARPSVMPAGAMMGFRRWSEPSWVVCAVRTVSCGRSARSCQKRRPGSRGRPARYRPGLPVHDGAPGRIPDRHHGPRPRGFEVRLLRLQEAAPSARAQTDSLLLKRIRTIHVTSHATYGVPRVHAELRAGGEKHRRKRIARLMRTAGIAGVSRRRSSVVTPTASLILFDLPLPQLSATRTSRQSVCQSPREAEAQCCD